MLKILTGVFLGVFIGTLGYELVNRSNPEVIERIRSRMSEVLDDFMVSDGSDEQGV